MNNGVLDVSKAKTVDEVIYIQVNHEITTGRAPTKFLFDSKVQLRRMFNHLIYIGIEPFTLSGIRVIFKEDIKKWQEFREFASSIEFWSQYWALDSEAAGLDPLEEGVT